MNIRAAKNPIIFITATALFLLVHLIFINKTYRYNNESTLKIVKGDNLRTVAVKLEANQIIFNKYIFIIAGKLMGLQEELIPGEYSFANGLTNINILKEITDVSIVRSYTITIPEGMNIRQIGRLMHKLYGLDSARFVQEAKNDSLLNLLGIKAENLEGYLYPDTYQISYAINSNREQEIIRIMASEFRKKITPELKDEMKKKNLTLKDAVTMASIIEGETRYDAEKKTIAGVYYNRLKIGMKLEADPTVQYALPGGPKRQLMYSDLKIQSPYNTYIHKGLPPGPINNPALSSILAAIYPEKNKFMYFVAKGDGSHRFAETYDEHKKNIEQYRKYLKEKEDMKDKAK